MNMICLPHEELNGILAELSTNIAILDYARVAAALVFLGFLFSGLVITYSRAELATYKKLNAELVTLFNKIQEDKFAVDDGNSGSEEEEEDVQQGSFLQRTAKEDAGPCPENDLDDSESI
jgi:hypothetical protein